jgi:hypothetical protein
MPRLRRKPLHLFIASALACGCVLGTAVPVFASSGRAASAPRQAWSARVSASRAQALSRNATDRVIVLLRNQQTKIYGISRENARANVLEAQESPVVSELREVHAPRIVRYRILGAVAATVSRSGT